MESIKAMAEFTEVLKYNPSHAYDFICSNYWKLSKAELAEIVKELLYAIHKSCSDSQMEQLLDDVAIELDEQYDEQYQSQY